MSESPEAAPAVGEAIRRIMDALDGLQFGSVEVAVHDGQIVRITRTETVRIASRSAEKRSSNQRT